MSGFSLGYDFPGGDSGDDGGGVSVGVDFGDGGDGGGVTTLPLSIPRPVAPVTTKPSTNMWIGLAVVGGAAVIIVLLVMLLRR